MCYEVHTTSFQSFFVWAFKIGEDSWKFNMLLLYILWDDWSIFIISGSKEQLQHELEYTLLKPDNYSLWISKMISYILKERYAIKFRFKPRKMPQKRIECFRLLLEYLVWIKHQFSSGIRDSRKTVSLWGDDERWGRSKEVNRPELIGQTVRVSLSVIMLRF